MHNKIGFLICHFCSCSSTLTIIVIVDVKFVVLGFTYKYWGYVKLNLVYSFGCWIELCL